MTESDLSGRVALVTGASRGIGAATALRLAEAGADVAVGCGQHREAAEEIAGKITGLGRRAVVVSGDMADPDVPRRIIAETAERLGPVDILVANAGTGTPGLIATDMLLGDPRLDALERSVPVGRLGQPAEVADLIVAARNAYMTGQTVSVDGGRYPR